MKALTPGAGLAVISLIAGFANGWLQHPLTEGGLTTSRWPWFFSSGLALTGGALAGSVVLLLATGLAVRTLAAPCSHQAGTPPAPAPSSCGRTPK